MAVTLDVQSILTEGWSVATGTADSRAIATNGWWITDPSAVIPSEETSGEFGVFHFRVPPITASPMEVRRAFQDVQTMLKTITKFLPELGDTFPASPGNGKPFYKSDEGILYIFDVNLPGWIPAFSGGVVPTENNFELVDGSEFELMDGDDFILVELGT